MKAREALPAGAFVFPDREAWPIHDLEHAKIALAYMKQGRGDSTDYPAIRKAIKKRYPELGESTFGRIRRKLRLAERDLRPGEDDDPTEDEPKPKAKPPARVRPGATPPPGQPKGHPLIIKRCVYAIAKRDPTPAGLSRAFAICIASAQERGLISRGSELTPAGKEAEKDKAAASSDYGYTDSAYEKLLATVRGKRRAAAESKAGTLLDLYYELHERLLGEAVESSPRELRAALAGIAKSLRSLKTATKTPGNIPLVMRQLTTYALGVGGKPGVLGALGVGGLASAVGLKDGTEVDRAVAGLQAALSGAPEFAFDWGQMALKLKGLAALAKDFEQTMDPAELTSLLTDVFIELAGATKALTKVSCPKVATAATDVWTAFKNQHAGFMNLSLSLEGDA